MQEDALADFLDNLYSNYNDISVTTTYLKDANVLLKMLTESETAFELEVRNNDLRITVLIEAFYGPSIWIDFNEDGELAGLSTDY